MTEFLPDDASGGHEKPYEYIALLCKNFAQAATLEVRLRSNDIIRV
jgi:hypothetical protein